MAFGNIVYHVGHHISSAHQCNKQRMHSDETTNVRSYWHINTIPRPTVDMSASGWLQSAVTRTDGLVTECLHYNGCHTLICIFIVECGITRFLCTMCVLKVQASSSSLGYLCAKFRFFRGLRCWASPWRKIQYSITQSITQLIWCPGNRSFCFGTYWVKSLWIW